MRTLVIALLLLPIASSAQFSTATYTVTFESTWSAATHPDDFPPDPHFSGLVGAAHRGTVTLWEPGGLASPGIESMAETGSKTLLESEVSDLITAGNAFAVLSGDGIGTSPGSVSLTFDLNTDYPLVSLVSMLAPSPDWFVGVSGYALGDGGDHWLVEEVVTLYVYDAGTDSGVTYTAPDSDTQPPDPIEMIVGFPFFYDGEVRAVGTFHFVLDGVVVSTEDETPAASSLRLSPPFPNPAQSESALRLDVGAAQTVRIEVFDLLGRRVRMVHDGVLAAGSHRVIISTSELSSGVYIVRVMGEQNRQTRRLVVR